MTLLRRGVRFQQATKVCVVSRPSKAESKKLWYTKKELKRIRSDIKCSMKESVDSSSGSSASEEEEYKWTGLDRLKRACLALEHQQTFVRGVLSLQKLHKKLGIRDDKALTLFVSAYNKDAVQRATRIAKQDFAEARQIYKEIEAES